MNVQFLIKMILVISVVAVMLGGGIPLLMNANANAANLLPDGFNETVSGNFNMPLLYNLPAKMLANELNKFSETECYEQLPAFNNFFKYYSMQILEADGTKIFRIVDGNGQTLDPTPKIYGTYCLAKSKDDIADINSITLKKVDNEYIITSGIDTLATVNEELIEEGMILYKKGSKVCLVVDNPEQFTSLPTCTSYTLEDYSVAFEEAITNCDSAAKDSCACSVWLPDVKDVQIEITNSGTRSEVTFTKGEEEIKKGFNYLFDTQPSDQRSIQVGVIETPRGDQPKIEFTRFYPKELAITNNILRASNGEQYNLENNFFIFKNKEITGIGSLAGERIEPLTTNRMAIIDTNNINVEGELNLCGAAK